MKKITIFITLVSLMSASLLFSQDLSGIRIYVNPGHGGHDSDDRYIAATGFWESEGNLTKGLYLKTLLENMGATVGISRTTNYTSDDLPLSTISAMANDFQADIFESIHSNGFNGELNYTLMLYRGWDPGVTAENYDMTVTGALFPLAGEMAPIMGTEIYKSHRTTNNHVRGDWSFYSWTDSQGNRSGLGVLRGLNMPGTLSEGSFHDYVPESWRLQNLDYRREESWAIARSFVKLYDQPDFPFRNLSGVVRNPLETVPYFYINGTNDNKKPVNDVTASLYQEGTLVETYTGDNKNNGFYLFDSLAPGTYTLIVEAEDFYPDTQEVVIGDAFYNHRDVNLISSQPPVVLASTPTQDETSHPAWNPITIYFSHEMDTASVRANLSLTPAEDLIFSWNTELRILTLKATDDSLAFETQYTLTIGGNTLGNRGLNLDGNGDGTSGDDYTLTFTTSAQDITPPSISSDDMYPLISAENIETDVVINLVFDEILADENIDTNHLKLQNYTEDYFIDVDIIHDIIGNRSVISLAPASELNPQSIYRTYVYQGGLKDLFDNYMFDRTRAYRFTTGYAYTSKETVDNFEVNFTKWHEPKYSGSTVGLVTGTVEQTTEKVLPILNSTQAMKLSYEFDETADAHLLREYQDPQSFTFDNSYRLQVYIYGMGNNISFRFAVDDDITGNAGHEVSPWIKVDWYGWRLVSWDIANDGTGEWLGDGSVDGTLRMDSFQFTWHEDANPSGVLYLDELRIVTKTASSVENSLSEIPQSITLHGNYPNPFNPETTIAFSMPEGQPVILSVYSINGTLIRRYARQTLSAGYHELTWDGRDQSGKEVSSGEYIYRVETPTQVSAGKMLFLK
ncbi:Ig-like domain-containing protein [Fidelibacter multiformis]|uniref:Ig-like domain-containing protein n=1 Tax=Fidelibacter multiformis TaxID=3377529 RepID=UPI0037DD94EA